MKFISNEPSGKSFAKWISCSIFCSIKREIDFVDICSEYSVLIRADSYSPMYDTLSPIAPIVHERRGHYGGHIGTIKMSWLQLLLSSGILRRTCAFFSSAWFGNAIYMFVYTCAMYLHRWDRFIKQSGQEKILIRVIRWVCEKNCSNVAQPIFYQNIHLHTYIIITVGEPLRLSGKGMEWENKWHQKIPNSLPGPGNLLKYIIITVEKM
jgi:hypothetical protein